MKKLSPILLFLALTLWRVVCFGAVATWVFVRLIFSMIFSVLGASTTHDDHNVPLEATKGGIRAP